jgi:hypothetical protein
MLTCTGFGCVDLSGIPTISCTGDGNTLSCTNGVKCSGPANYTAQFTMNQNNQLVHRATQLPSLTDRRHHRGYARREARHLWLRVWENELPRTTICFCLTDSIHHRYPSQVPIALLTCRVSHI